MNWRDVALSTLISSSVAYAAARFLISKILDARITFHYAKKLQELKEESARGLVILTSGLKKDGDERLATLTSELKEQADSRLTSLSSSLKERADKELAELNAELANRNNENLAELNRKYAGEIEEAKAKLFQQGQNALEVFRLRLQAYQDLGYDVRELRNLARDMLNLSKAEELKKEYDDRLASLEDHLSKLGIRLTGDRVFLPIHTYKNDAATYRMEIEYFLGTARSDQPSREGTTLAALRPIYQRMDEQYQEIIDALAALTTP